MVFALYLSLPSRERGLKHKFLGLSVHHRQVAPFAGAWIETIAVYATPSQFKSLPSRERGLKLFQSWFICSIGVSLPSRERGLKLPDKGGVNIHPCRSLRGSVD